MMWEEWERGRTAEENDGCDDAYAKAHSSAFDVSNLLGYR